MEYDVFVRAFVFCEYLHSMRGQKLILNSLSRVIGAEFQAVKARFLRKKQAAAFSQAFSLNLSGLTRVDQQPLGNHLLLQRLLWALGLQNDRLPGRPGLLPVQKQSRDARVD